MRPTIGHNRLNKKRDDMKNIRVKKVGAGLSVALGIGLTALVGSSVAQLACPEPVNEKLDTIYSLKGVPVPLPAALDTIVKNRTLAVVLGKAWFWDKQVGSDGQACASCHSHAGADGRRITNQLNPGMNANPQDLIFNPMRTGGKGPNYTFKLADFPFHVLSNPLDRNSSPSFDTNDIATSQGVYSGAGTFQQFFGLSNELCSTTDGAPFVVNGKRTRATPPRNTPTTINAIFQFRSFWDGRANNHFNGVDPFGRRSPEKILVVKTDGSVGEEILDLENAALASQAVGPVLSTLEASCANRGFQRVGRKLLSGNLRPLDGQKVDPTDSVLGLFADAGTGLKAPWTYKKLIQDTFEDKYWNAPGYDADPTNPYTLMEENFSLFWGIAIMLYESTLVSDQTPFDKYMGTATTPPDFTALTAKQINGMSLFIGKGKCVNCHKGPDFTGAGFRAHAEFQEGGIVERMEMAANGVALYDNGFYNIGVRPSNEDLGVGGTDQFGHPLSFARQYKKRLAGNNVPDSFQINKCTFESDPCQTITNPSTHRDAVDGAFKTPTLRNIELTGPYMHNGGMATLEQVIDFYNRGGDRRGQDGDDTTGFDNSSFPDRQQWGHNKSNLDPDITSLDLKDYEKADLVAFLKALTDERVRCEEAPFDHPALGNSNGHSTLDGNNDGRLDELTMRLPAVGKGGLKAKGLACLKPFHEYLK